MATTKSLATLVIDVTANNTKLIGELNKANGHLDGFAKTAESAGRLVKVAFAAATTGMFANMVKESVDVADRMGKLSQRLGIATEALSEYKHVAELSGVPFNTLTMGLQRMTRRVSEAAAGTGEAKKALAELGISAQRLNQLAPDQQFEVLADALADVSNEGDRVRLAMKFFDSEGVALVQTMGQGADGIRNMREEARKLGLTLSNEDAMAAAQFNDQMTRAQATLNALAKEIALNSVTAFNTLAEAFSAAGEQATDSAPDLSQIQDIIKGAGASAFVAFNSVQALSEGIVSLGFAVSQVLSGNFSGALSELEIGFERMQSQIDEAIEGVDRLFNVTGQFGGEEGEPGEGNGIASIFAPTVQDVKAVPGEETEDPLKRILGGDPDEVLERLNSQLMTEEEQIINSYVQRQETINAFLKNREGFEGEHHKLTLKNAQKFQKDMEKAQKNHNKQTWTEDQKLQRNTLSATASFFGVMAKENKAFAIGQALINTYLGVSQSLAAYPMPIAAVMAATHLAAGLQNLQAIKSGGGAGGGSATGGGVPSIPEISGTDDFAEAAEEAPTQKVVTIAVQGVDDDALLTKSQLRQVVDQINEEASANVRINI